MIYDIAKYLRELVHVDMYTIEVKSCFFRKKIIVTYYYQVSNILDPEMEPFLSWERRVIGHIWLTRKGIRTHIKHGFGAYRLDIMANLVAEKFGLERV